MKIFLIINLLVIFFTGCSSINRLKTYEGTNYSSDELALVKVKPNLGVGVIGYPECYCYSSEGAFFSKYCEISLLPGFYTFYIVYWSESLNPYNTTIWRSEDKKSLLLDAKAGHVYQITYELDYDFEKKHLIWRTWIEDETKGGKSN